MTHHLHSKSQINKELYELIASNGGIVSFQQDEAYPSVQVYGAIVDRIERHLTFAENNLYTEKQRHIIFAFINNPEFNAFAYAPPPSENNSFDFIGINFGILRILENLFGRILSHPDNFPDVGSPQLEDTQRCLLDPNITLSSQIDYVPVRPKCIIRAMFAGELIQTAVDFIIYHEITHLKNGHIEFVRNHLSLNALEEILNQELSEDELMIRQALEIDADCGAVMLTFSYLFHMHEMFKQIKDPDHSEMMKAARASYATKTCIVRIVSYVTFLIFRMYNNHCWDSDSQLSTTHPFPAIRAFYPGPTLFEILSRDPYFKFDPMQFVQEHSKFICQAELAYARIYNKMPDAAALLSVPQNPNSSTYLESFKRNWAKIRPLLQNHTRCGDLTK